MNLFILAELLVLPIGGFSQTIDFSGSSIVCFEKNNSLVLKSVAVLLEEINKRSNILLGVNTQWPLEIKPVIFVGQENELGQIPKELSEMISKMDSIKNEGYKIAVNENMKSVVVIGHDPRGVLYGVGKLLRNMEIRPEKILIPSAFSIASTPQYPIRGHQLGYRPKTNAYDAWTPEQFDQYIRELAIFGANSIEIMPPHTDDDFSNVNMKLEPIKMIAKQSEICDSYGMDVWMWYPNMGENYTHPDSIKKEIEERREVFKAVKRLDNVFVPAGDPGDLEPEVLFEWLHTVAEMLHQYHPKAKIWVSPQVFHPTKEWFDSFFSYVNNEYPWLGGVVFGPWVKLPIKQIRQLVNSGIPIRRYPDITHTFSCQYPIPQWDLAFATTLGRECFNPRPIDEKIIHNAFDELAQGSISYSEGINDDVNKMIWSGQDWDPGTPVMETMREYARFFISPDFTESIALGLIAEEQNFHGPLLINDGIMKTLAQWQEMELHACDKILANYRFQMGLIRAYYDAYQYRRLLFETLQEQTAYGILSSAPEIGSLRAISEARGILLKTSDGIFEADLKKRCYALADSLYKNIGAQLTVEKHHGKNGRGNFIDNIDHPLNDALWLLAQLTRIEKMPLEKTRLKEIESVAQRTNPGAGGFYDNFGSPASWERIKSDVSWSNDPGSLISPRVSFGLGLKDYFDWMQNDQEERHNIEFAPKAWMSQATTLYDQPLIIVYDHLDPQSSYVIRVTYTGRFNSKMKMTADGIPVHDYIKTGIQPVYEFAVPPEAVADGVVEFKWVCENGGRGSQVAEIWIINTSVH